jgi:hypothetical protein
MIRPRRAGSASVRRPGIENRILWVPVVSAGQQAIDEQIQQYHVQLNPSTDLSRY